MLLIIALAVGLLPASDAHGCITKPKVRPVMPYCPWCVGEHSGSAPVAHDTPPSSPCLGKASMSPWSIEAGKTYSTEVYLNADHDGDARWEICIGGESEDCFRKGKITEYKSVHWPWGGKKQDHWKSAQKFEEKLTIPAGQKGGKGVMRWIWKCHYTDEIFLSCIDVNVKGGSGASTGGGGGGGGGSSGGCSDKAGSKCAGYKNYCQHNQYKTWMASNCAATCGACGGGGSCTDKQSNCRQFQKLCKLAPCASWMQSNCGQTCGSCGACLDQSSKCAGWRNYCHSGSYRDWMSKNCPKTCGKCGKYSSTGADAEEFANEGLEVVGNEAKEALSKFMQKYKEGDKGVDQAIEDLVAAFGQERVDRAVEDMQNAAASTEQENDMCDWLCANPGRALTLVDTLKNSLCSVAVIHKVCGKGPIELNVFS